MAFSYLSPDKAFLDPDRVDACQPDKAQCVVVPFGLEKTVSYGTGTARGPQAILEASHQLELYDVEFGCQPCDDYGIATLTPTKINTNAPLKDTLGELSEVVRSVLSADRFPFVIGGEHALTPAAVLAVAEKYPEVIIVQFDAHADLRDGYLGECYSHASAMRRVLDIESVSLISLGVRAVSQPEVAFYNQNRDRIQIHWAKDQNDWNVEDIVAPLKGRDVYLTFDIDVLDASEMPATGTPTPGGLSYTKALAILKRVCSAANIVGADLVEFAPIQGLHAYDYLAAELAYKLMSYGLLSDARTK